jgi:tRNA pseudouridine13 synthase
VHASGGLFRVEAPAWEQPRADAFEISATGPIVGTRALEPGGAVAERERLVLAHFGLDPAQLRTPPRGIRLRGTRRPLRVRPESPRLERDAAGDLWLHFSLPPGSYATVLLEEVVGCRRAEPR